MKRASADWEKLRADYERVVIEQTGVTITVAASAARVLLLALQVRMGGADVYVPRAPKYDEDAILREFTGSNGPDVARRHGVHVATIYRIWHRRRARTAAAKPAQPGPQAPKRGFDPEFNW